jgi:hypothetical protein
LFARAGSRPERIAFTAPLVKNVPILHRSVRSNAGGPV